MTTPADDQAVETVEAIKDTPLRRGRQDRWIDRHPWTVVTVVAFALRLFTAGHGVVTVDEPTWMARSQAFFTALTHGHLSRMSVPINTPKTRPGVTTMWIGSAARGITLGAHKVGLMDGITTPFERSSFGLAVAQGLVALVSALLIGLVFALTTRLLGRWIGGATGLLLLAEPFLLGHTVVLHTDGILALALVGSALSLMVAMRLGVADDPGDPPRWRWAAVAGGLAGLALLTKVSALAYLPGFAVPVAVAGVQRVRATSAPPVGAVVRDLARVAGLVIGGLLVTTIVLWPALWVDPVHQIRALVDSARLGDEGHSTFFRGRATTDPGRLYYLFVIPLRTSPVVLLGALGGVATLVVRRAQRGTVAVIALLPVPYLILISLSTKQFDRYALPVIITMAILAAVAVVDLATRLAPPIDRFLRDATPYGRRYVTMVLTIGACFLLFESQGLAGAYPLAYFDPLAGGSHRAEQTILVGWGEGLEQAGRAITKDRKGECDGVVTAVPAIHNYISFPCGVIVPLRARVYQNLSDITYAVDSISEDQRNTKTHRDYFALVRQQGTLIKTVRIRGLTYARVYRIDHPPPGACKDDLQAVPYAARCG